MFFQEFKPTQHYVFKRKSPRLEKPLLIRRMKQEFLLHEKQVFQEVIIKTQGETKNETVKIH